MGHAKTETETEKTPRKAQRIRTLKSAKIITLNQWSVIDCSVRDLSATGAKIQSAQQIAVPNEFRFLLLSDDTIRKAKVVWRRADLIGIEFTSQPEKAPARKF